MNLPRQSSFLVVCLVLVLAAAPVNGEPQDPGQGSLNRPERLEWFRDQGFGLFIHWSVDSQLGTVISHSLVGASDDYTRRFFDELPRTFNPRLFHPEDWAALAKLAGIRYVVFTAKHHSGFCMWPTATTDFSIAHTPFPRDITGEIIGAFRAQGIAPGLYESPDDFWWLWKNGKVIQRGIPSVQPAQNPGLMRHNQDQVRELLTRYGGALVIGLMPSSTTRLSPLWSGSRGSWPTSSTLSSWPILTSSIAGAAAGDE